MRVDPATLEARRALLAQLDDALHEAFAPLRAISSDWSKRERELLRAALEKDPVGKK